MPECRFPPPLAWYRGMGVVGVLVIGSLLSGCTVKTEPITQDEVERRVHRDMANLFAEQEPSSFQIGLHEATARAIKYNLKQRIRQMEAAIAVEDLNLAKRSLQPKLIASAGYSLRTSEGLRRDKNSGLTWLEKDDQEGEADLTWSWSALDFGVSYFRARQRADRVLLNREQQRKSIQNIVQEVRDHYWQASMSDRLMPMLDGLLARAQRTRQDLIRMEAAGQEIPSLSLENQQKLLETVRRLWQMRQRLVEAKSALGTLMNLPPGTPFLLNPRQGELLDDRLAYLSPVALDHYALLHGAALRGEDYQERISALEVRKVLLGMLPNLGLTEELAFNNNDYLQNNSWASMGMRLSWNLLELTTTPNKLAVARLEKEIIRSRRMALSMAAITQIRLALQSYHLARREWEIAVDLDRLQARKVRQVMEDQGEKGHDEMDRLQQQAQSLAAQVALGVALSEVQQALGRLHLTLGIDPLAPDLSMDKVDVRTMANMLTMRQASVSSAVISATPSDLLRQTTTRPPSPRYALETDTGSLDKDGTGAVWRALGRFSDRMGQVSGASLDWIGSSSPTDANGAPLAYLPPGSVAPRGLAGPPSSLDAPAAPVEEAFPVVRLAMVEEIPARPPPLAGGSGVDETVRWSIPSPSPLARVNRARLVFPTPRGLAPKRVVMARSQAERGLESVEWKTGLEPEAASEGISGPEASEGVSGPEASEGVSGPEESEVISGPEEREIVLEPDAESEVVSGPEEREIALEPKPDAESEVVSGPDGPEALIGPVVSMGPQESVEPTGWLNEVEPTGWLNEVEPITRKRTEVGSPRVLPLLSPSLGPVLAPVTVLRPIPLLGRDSESVMGATSASSEASLNRASLFDPVVAAVQGGGDAPLRSSTAFTGGNPPNDLTVN